MSCEYEGKRSWPELLGARGVVAAATIEKENRHVSAKIELEGTFVTLEFSCSRVRVWVNTEGIVTKGSCHWIRLAGSKGGSIYNSP